MYCSKYALSRGITMHVGYVSNDGYFNVRDTYGINRWKLGRDVHETHDAAREAAEKMRLKKIASLEKQLEKLKSMTF